MGEGSRGPTSTGVMATGPQLPLLRPQTPWGRSKQVWGPEPQREVEFPALPATGAGDPEQRSPRGGACTSLLGGAPAGRGPGGAAPAPGPAPGPLVPLWGLKGDGAAPAAALRAQQV